MKFLKAICFLVLFSFVTEGNGSQISCMNLFKHDHTQIKNGQVQSAISPLFSRQQRRIILSALKDVEKMIGKMDRPSSIEFLVLDDLPDPVMAEPYSEKIYFKSSFLKLSPNVFRAMVVHEITHLIIFRNFTDNRGETLREKLLRTQDSLVFYSHVPFAELLCDTMAVLIFRDPTVFSRSISEATNIWSETDPTFRERFEKVIDSPRRLSVRDFSVPYDDLSWTEYNPQDLVYNRFNQIRSYLYQRWISRLPSELNAQFYLELYQLIADVYKSNGLDAIVSFYGIEKSNSELMAYLDQELGKKFPGLN